MALVNRLDLMDIFIVKRQLRIIYYGDLIIFTLHFFPFTGGSITEHYFVEIS